MQESAEYRCWHAGQGRQGGAGTHRADCCSVCCRAAAAACRAATSSCSVSCRSRLSSSAPSDCTAASAASACCARSVAVESWLSSLLTRRPSFSLQQAQPGPDPISMLAAELQAKHALLPETHRAAVPDRSAVQTAVPLQYHCSSTTACCTPVSLGVAQLGPGPPRRRLQLPILAGQLLSLRPATGSQPDSRWEQQRSNSELYQRSQCNALTLLHCSATTAGPKAQAETNSQLQPDTTAGRRHRPLTAAA